MPSWYFVRWDMARDVYKRQAMDQLLFWLVPAASVLALCFAWYFHRQMMKESEGTPQMIKIAAAVRNGAMSYLRQQYKIVAVSYTHLDVYKRQVADGFNKLKTAETSAMVITHYQRLLDLSLIHICARPQGGNQPGGNNANNNRNRNKDRSRSRSSSRRLARKM